MVDLIDIKIIKLKYDSIIGIIRRVDISFCYDTFPFQKKTMEIDCYGMLFYLHNLNEEDTMALYEYYGAGFNFDISIIKTGMQPSGKGDVLFNDGPFSFKTPVDNLNISNGTIFIESATIIKYDTTMKVV